jgi:dCTP deaminase
MILTDNQILKGLAEGTIVIEPYRREYLGTNSYDIHLSKYMTVYGIHSEDCIKSLTAKHLTETDITLLQKSFKIVQLDAKIQNPTTEFEIPETGILLVPGILYLGSTLEYTETNAHVPFLEGKSSMGRLGTDIHATAGKGDVGFRNYWTLEISCIQPVRIYPGMPVGQMIYFETSDDIENYYNKKSDAKYTQRSPKPAGSAMWKNFIDGKWNKY